MKDTLQIVPTLPASSPAFGEEKWISLLSQIVAHPELEREWLDMLSQLEFVGCRKIMKAVPFEGMTLEVLRHLSEEASHAFLLKSVAEALGLASRHWGGGIFSAAGWNYFKSLDANVSALPGSRPAYASVSWAIESRVMQVYPVYAEHTRVPAVKRVLTQILAQEQRHGREFDAIAFPQGHREAMLALESEQWEGFETEIENAIQTYLAAV